MPTDEPPTDEPTDEPPTDEPTDVPSGGPGELTCQERDRRIKIQIGSTVAALVAMMILLTLGYVFYFVGVGGNSERKRFPSKKKKDSDKSMDMARLHNEQRIGKSIRDTFYKNI